MLSQPLPSLPHTARSLLLLVTYAGSNGTALGIQGAVIPGAGKNKVMEPDTTVFKGDATDSCGRTNSQGDNDIEAGAKSAIALSSSTCAYITFFRARNT